MAKLNLYEDESGGEYVAVVTNSEFEKDCEEDGLELKQSIVLSGSCTAWPTDRLLRQLELGGV